MQARHPVAPPWLHAPSYAPALRVDVRLVPHDDEYIRLYEPTMQRYVQLFRLECHIAQLMNGRRGLEELTELARQFNPTITREALERLVVNLNAVGLLDHTTGSTAAPANVPPPGALEDADLGFDEDTVLNPAAFDRAPILAPSPAVDEATRAPVAPLRVVSPPPPLPSPEPVPEIEPDADDAEAAPETDAPDADAPDADAPEADAPDAPAEQSPEEIAAQEQEAMWNQERKRPLHKRRWVRVLAVLAVLGGLAAVIPYPLHVTSECTILPSEQVKVRSELPGVLSEILVDEGQQVKKGDVVARLDDRALKSERLKVLAEIDKIDAELANLRHGRRPEEIQQQEAVLAGRQNEAAFSAKEAHRRVQMAREGVGSRQAADEASRESESRRRAVAEAQAALRLLKAGARPEEIAAQEAVLKRARAELAFIDERLTMSVVRAPIDGKILTARFRERVNESVEAGGLVCEIANTRKMRAEVFVPEREVDVVALGMPVVVKVESYPTRPFEGKVDFIAPSVDGKDRRVRVVVELANDEGLLKANMTGYGEVEAGSRSLLNLATRRIIRWVRVRFLI